MKKWEKPVDHREVITDKILAIDFDGVIHNNNGFDGWKGADVIDGSVMPGAEEFIELALDKGYIVVVYSSRFLYGVGVSAVNDWLRDNFFPIEDMFWSIEKPPAKIFLDDCAVRFNTNFDEVVL